MITENVRSRETLVSWRKTENDNKSYTKRVQYCDEKSTSLVIVKPNSETHYIVHTYNRQKSWKGVRFMFVSNGFKSKILCYQYCTAIKHSSYLVATLQR